MRLEIGAADGAHAAIEVVHRGRFAALAHGRLPFEALPADLAAPRRPGRRRFGVLFVLHPHDRLTPHD